MGAETEYAIRFEAPVTTPHPGNEELFERIASAAGDLVHTRLAEAQVSTRFFTENGGTFMFEHVLPDQEGGLFEAGTPECRGPAQVLLYQRAQDQLLANAVRLAEERLRNEGVEARLGLLKNCRDAQGNVYGAQESYEVFVARGPRLWLWRLALLSAAPLALGAAAITLTMLVTTLLLVVVVLFVATIVAALAGRDEPDVDEIPSRVASVMQDFVILLFQPSFVITSSAASLLAYRPYQRRAMGFFVSRCIVSGAGTRKPDGRWALSEKMADLRRVMRLTIGRHDRGLFETGHLVKPLQWLALLRWRSFADAFAKRQRLQIGMSDANRCDVAEYLKLGTTALVLDMVEAGVLRDAPRPRDPVAAARAISDDATLQVRVPLRGGGEASALELQRTYLERAQTWIEEVAAPVEAHQLVKLWSQTLDALESDPSRLFGQLDWITKQTLVERAGPLDHGAQKKIDLRYHELGEAGYFTWLDGAELVTRLVEPEDIREAIRTPPVDSPARQRGRIVKALSQSGQSARIGWKRVHLGRGLQGRIIRLDEHRRNPRNPNSHK